MVNVNCERPLFSWQTCKKQALWLHSGSGILVIHWNLIERRFETETSITLIFAELTNLKSISRNVVPKDGYHSYLPKNIYLQCVPVPRESILSQEYAFIKKSTIFSVLLLTRTLFWQSLVMGKNYGFFIKAYFWLSIDSPGTHCTYIKG